MPFVIFVKESSTWFHTKDAKNARRPRKSSFGDSFQSSWTYLLGVPMSNVPKYDIDNSFGTIVHWAERALIQRLQRNFEDGGFDVTVEQWRVLVNLWNREGQSQRELAAATHKDKTAITRILHGMEERDLVVRTPDRDDQRNKRIYLTRKGRDHQRALVTFTHKAIEQALEGIPEEEVEVCRRVLRGVIRNLAGPESAGERPRGSSCGTGGLLTPGKTSGSTRANRRRARGVVV